MNKEIFIMGDARYLSGGARRNQQITCDSQMPLLGPGEPVVETKDVLPFVPEFPTDPVRYAYRENNLFGQCVHHGRDSYHRHEYHPRESTAAPGFNVFCRPGDIPTLGVELETYCRRSDAVADMRSELVSNWFHFEEDGSLDRTVGHELITEPLPPRVYRNIATWIGLQNLISPWLDSWSRSDTGLHVHVGLTQFDKCDGMPFDLWSDRRRAAQWAVAFVYSMVVGYEIGDRVFLRRNGSYCSMMGDKRLLEGRRLSASGKLRATDMFDWIAATFCTGVRDSSLLTTMADGHKRPGDYVSRSAFSDSDWSSMTGHHVEVNFQHSETVEFRRGKGTTNAVSIHRMVEFCSLLVRYVYKAARNPEMTVSPETAYEYIINLTTSPALRKTAEETWSKIRKG